MRYFKATLVWVIILAAIAGYSYLDLESTRIEEKKKEEATRLLPFSPKDVLAIILDRGADVIELERWEQGWRIVRPVTAGADGEAVEKFLGYVTDSRNDADYVMDPDPTPERLKEFGLDNPKVKVTLKAGKELTPYTLVFGDRAPTMGVAFARLDGHKPVFRVLAYARAEADKDVFYFRDKTVLGLSPVMVDQLSIVHAGGTTIRAKLPQDGRWTLEKPVRTRAEHNKVFELIGMFANAEVKEFVSESKSDLASYGLAKPEVELLLWQAGDAEPTVRLAVGERSPQKRGYFCAMTGRDGVFVLDEEVIHAIPRDARALRSRELFFFDRDQLKRIEIRLADRATVLVKDMEKDWRRNNESGDKVEFGRVKDLLDELMAVRIKDFIEDDPKNLADYGLDPPVAQVLIWPEHSAMPIHLSVGAKAPSGFVYAFSGAEKTVLALDGAIIKSLRLHL